MIARKKYNEDIDLMLENLKYKNYEEIYKILSKVDKTLDNYVLEGRVAKISIETDKNTMTIENNDNEKTIFFDVETDKEKQMSVGDEVKILVKYVVKNNKNKLKMIKMDKIEKVKERGI